MKFNVIVLHIIGLDANLLIARSIAAQLCYAAAQMCTTGIQVVSTIHLTAIVIAFIILGIDVHDDSVRRRLKVYLARKKTFGRNL